MRAYARGYAIDALKDLARRNPLVSDALRRIDLAIERGVSADTDAAYVALSELTPDRDEHGLVYSRVDAVIAARALRRSVFAKGGST